MNNISVRDFFASCAMQGFTSSAGLELSDADIARVSYQLADAMLAERQRTLDDAVKKFG